MADTVAQLQMENRRIALTFLEAHLKEDEEQQASILTILTPRELAAELADISLILAGTLSQFMSDLRDDILTQNDPLEVISSLRETSSIRNTRKR